MSTKAIRSSYTIDGLLGLNRDDDHKQCTKVEHVFDEAAVHKPGHSTDERKQGSVYTTSLITLHSRSNLSMYFTNKLDIE